MEIISPSTVELTNTERFANARFEGMLDQGYSIYVAARRTEELFPGLDPAFYRWLQGRDATPSEWHTETWNLVCDTLRETFEEQGFEIHVNGPAGTLTIIERTHNQALTVTPASHTSYGFKHGAAALAH